MARINFEIAGAKFGRLTALRFFRLAHSALAPALDFPL